MKRTATQYVARTLLCLAIALLLSSSVLATSPPTPTVPADVRALVAPDDMVLAFHKGDVTGEGTKGLVLVIYHGESSLPKVRDGFYNPCDLIVYEEFHGQWKESARNRGVVDCVANRVMDHPQEMIYGADLFVTPGSITWCNQDIRSNVTFDFFYDRTKRRWYGQSASQAYPVERSGDPDAYLGSAYGDIAAPYDFPLTPMNELDAMHLQEVLNKHTKIEF